MFAEMTYGGWVSERPTATGVTSSVVRIVGWVAAAGAVLVGIGTGSEPSLINLGRNSEQTPYALTTIDAVGGNRVRTPFENLLHIREALRPAVSDLALTFGVSRQSVYNWLNGEPVSVQNSAKLQDLAGAADVLNQEGIVVNSALLKRKFASGRTLFEVAQVGESAREAALLLVQVQRSEETQRVRMNRRFVNRATTPATADFDLPASNDHI